MVPSTVTWYLLLGPVVTCQSSTCYPRMLSASSVCHHLGPSIGKSMWHFYPLWLTQMFYKGAHLEGSQSTMWNEVQENKRTEILKEINEKFVDSHTLWRLMHFETRILLVITQLWLWYQWLLDKAKELRVLELWEQRLNRKESIQQMIAIFFQSVIALEVANSRERFT